MGLADPGAAQHETQGNGRASLTIDYLRPKSLDVTGLVDGDSLSDTNQAYENPPPSIPKHS